VRERKQLAAFIALAIIIVVIGAQITPENYVKGIWYVNPITRYPDFVIGIASLKAYQKIKNYNIAPRVGTIIEIASIALFLLFYMGAEDVPRIYRYSFYYWIPIALIIIVFALQKGALSRLLTNKFLLLGGEISYGIYLTHLLILNTTNKHCTEASTGYKIAIVLVATVVLSYLSYRFYEKPANAAIKKWLKFKNKRG
jgi:peptidoglycan/LPS O-acetylase OafA/YrhL